MKVALEHLRVYLSAIHVAVAAGRMDLVVCLNEMLFTR